VFNNKIKKWEDDYNYLILNLMKIVEINEESWEILEILKKIGRMPKKNF